MRMDILKPEGKFITANHLNSHYLDWGNPRCFGSMGFVAMCITGIPSLSDFGMIIAFLLWTSAAMAIAVC